MDTNCTCHMVFSQRWIRLESTSGSKRWFRVRISRVYSYTTFIMYAAGVCCGEAAAMLDSVTIDHLCCVETRVRRWAGPHVRRHVRSTRCRGRVLCTALCTVYSALYCGRGDVTALPRIARQCHIATPRSPPCCQPQWPRWSSLLARLVSVLELCHYLNKKA